MSSPDRGPCLPSRRAAIAAGIRVAEEIGLLSVYPIHTLLQLNRQPLPPLQTFGYTPDIPNRLTNEVHLNIQKGQIHNLGVLHIQPFFHQHKKFFERAIVHCDALLLEGNPFSYREYKNPLAEAFFDQCFDTAATHQKTTYFIDEHRMPIIFFQGNFALPSTLLTAMAMSCDTRHAVSAYLRNDRQQVPLLSTRRNMLRLLAGIGLGSAWITRIPDTDNPDEYDGYIQRGRSAIMMRNTLTIANAAPTAKLLTITGNVHAQLFEHYFADPTLLEQDLHDYRVHDAIYSLPMQKMEPGGHELQEV
ncbi:hypothetical protein HY464_02970 [Candidatus Peregrinibacteria bacterium]|nr:hypothetical protein [Candidatus Peregrinibacteria bacterium]MBI4129630.1 hypothetical protein [Candidatus Peregrinibacteria bacterium]